MGRPLDTESTNSLTVRDNRTGKVYNVPYAPHIPYGAGRLTFALAFRIVDNSVPATAFKSMTAPRAPGEREENETEKGLRVSDRGFLNTAVLRSQITFIDGEAGGMCACGIKVQVNLC
jgi:citrate synthase